jgi:hypothetical protein
MCSRRHSLRDRLGLFWSAAVKSVEAAHKLEIAYTAEQCVECVSEVRLCGMYRENNVSSTLELSEEVEQLLPRRVFRIK